MEPNKLKGFPSHNITNKCEVDKLHDHRQLATAPTSIRGQGIEIPKHNTGIHYPTNEARASFYNFINFQLRHWKPILTIF